MSRGPGTGRTVVVTGGSRGIGAAIVSLLARRGSDVVFTFRNDGRAAHDVVDSCASLPGTVSALRYDLRGDDAHHLVAHVLERQGGLDSLILNAGVWSGGRLGDLDQDAWWDVVDTNLRGSVRLVRAALEPLRGCGSGSVLLMSSAVGLVGFPGDTAYASSKAALVGFARSLAKESGASGLRVNVLAPGFVDTDMTSEVGGRARERIAGRTVLGRFGTPEEIASAAVFLSEDATFATGVVLPIDGGWTL